MMLRPTLLAAAIVAAAIAPAAAQKVVKKEPPRGALKQGEVVLVDDGSCGPGKIKEVRGGSDEQGVRRTRACIDRR
jgi:hypothetical protein